MSAPDQHELVIATDDGESVFALPPGRTSIGRSRDNVLSLREKSVSRFHCTLERDGDEVRVYDAMSRNPTQRRRRGEDTCAGAHGKLLDDGDTLIVGRVEIAYRSTASSGTSRSRRQADSDAPRGAGASSAAPSDAAPSGSGHRTLRPRRHSVARDLTGPRRTREAVALFGVLALLVISAAIFWSLRSPRGESTSVDVADERRVASLDDAASRAAEARVAAVLETSRRQAEALARLEGELARKQSQIDALRALEARLEAALRERDLDATRAAAPATRLAETRETLAALIAEERTLRGDLDEIRARPSNAPASTVLASDGTRGRDRWITSIDPEAVTGDRTRDDGPGGSRGSTVVEVIAQPRTLSKQEHGELVHRLSETVGNYALPSASPQDLEPDLTTLVHATGDAGARGLVEVYEYSQTLVRNLDTTVDMLERRVAALLAKAGVTGGEAPGEGRQGRGGSGYAEPQSPSLEQLQRLLELSDKKIGIKREQRVRLVAFQQALGRAFAALIEPDATRWLAGRFARADDDPELRRHILAAFTAARAVHAVPALIDLLRSRDRDLALAVEGALVAITGVRLGNARGPWEAWWKENGTR